jgi:hypothetical protein
MSRKKSESEIYSELIQFKVTPSMKAKIDKLSLKDMRKVSDWARLAITAAVESRGKELK